MASLLKWFWAKINSSACGGSGTPKGPKTLHALLGFFLLIDFSIGVGFLGIPYSFFYGGYLPSILTTLIAAIVNYCASIYVLEVMARAQVSYHAVQLGNIT